MRLRRKKSQLNIVEEVKPAKKKFLAGRIYFFLLYSAFLYIIYIFFINYFIVKTNGTILLNRHDISSPVKGQIAKIFVKKTDLVKKGSALAIVVADKEEVIGYKHNISKINDDYDLTLNRIFLIQKQIDRYSKDIEIVKGKNRLIRSLEIGLNDSELVFNDEMKIFELSIEADSLNKKRDLIKRERDLLRGELGEEVKNVNYIIRSPADGLIGTLYRHDYGTIDASDPLMVLTDCSKPGRILAYFRLDYMKYMRRGKLVKVELPDGEVIRTHILRFYSASIEAEKIEMYKYTPVKPKVAVELIPENAPYDFWLRYNEMEVTVKMKIW